MAYSLLALEGRPVVDILVAASDASDQERTVAHYVCDGTADDVQIQLALAKAVFRGVNVQLSRGTFNVAAPIMLDAPVSIRGVGIGKTILSATTGLDDYVLKMDDTVVGGIKGAVYSDFTIDGFAGDQTGGGCFDAKGAIDCTFERIRFLNAYNWGLVLGAAEEGLAFGHHNRVLTCLFDATILSPGYGGGLHITSSDENTVTSDFQFLGGSTAPSTLPRPVALYDQAGLNKILGSVFVGGRNDADHVWVHDVKMTQIVACTSDGSAGHAIVLTGIGHVVANNTLTSVGDQGSISGGAHGISIGYAGVGMVVTGNSLDSSSTADKTRSFIHCTADGGAGDSIIKNNVMRVVGSLDVGAIEDSGSGNIVTDNVTL